MEEATLVPFYHINATNATGGNVSIQDIYKKKQKELEKSLHTMSLIILCLAFVLGVSGNGVVIWVTGFKMKKTVNTIWFLNLAVADFLFTAFLPLNVAYIALDFHWPFGKFMCKLGTGINVLNMFTSVYILMVISMDRCVSVVWPVWAQNHRCVRKASFVSLGVWVLALILSAPHFIFRDTGLSPNNGNIYCTSNYAFSDDYKKPSVNQLRHRQHQATIINSLLQGFVVPFTVIVSCYAVIIHHLRRNRTLASQTSRPNKIIVAVITTFFLCWAPHNIVNVVEIMNYMPAYRSKTLYHVTFIGSPVTTSLAILNSCLNPLLYVFMGQDFKDKVCKSIMAALETAFREDVSDSKSMNTSQSKEMSALNTAV